MRYSDDMPSWYIDAKELWKCLIQQRENNKELSCSFTMNAGINQAVGLMNSLPSADVVDVVHGYWTFYSSHGEDEYEYKCSVCEDWANSMYYYCPYCGAKMDGDGNARKDN